MNVFKKIFGTSSQREVKAILPLVNKIEGLEEEYKALTDAQLQAKTPEFKQRLADGETLDDILPEAFAACREAAWRVLGMRPYRVQLIGGIILALVATLPIGIGKIANMNISLGGTSIIIVVGVALDTFRQLESQMMMRHYKGFLE